MADCTPSKLEWMKLKMGHFQYVQLLQLLAFKIRSTAGSLMLGAPAGIQSFAGTFLGSSDICLGAFCF